MSNRLPVLAAEIRAAHAGVQDAAKTAAERALEAGRALLEAKALVKHGEWLQWLRVHCDLPERTAQLYMHIARLGLEAETVAALGLKGAAKAVARRYPFPDPFADGTEEEQREWWLYCLFLVKSRGDPVQGAWNHIYWIRRHYFESPDEWLGPEGRNWVKTWGGQMGEEWLPRWQSFRSEQHCPTSEIVAELEQICQAEPDEPDEPAPKRRRRRKSATVADLGGAS